MVELLGLIFAVVLASAADVQEVAVEEVTVKDVAAQHSFLDVYASSSQRPAFNGVDLYQGPVIVLANTSGLQDNRLVAFFADNGIRSIVDSQKFQPLHQLLRASANNSGLVVGYEGHGDNSFLLNVVRDFVLPDNFKLYDLVRESVYTVPIVYVVPKGFFNNESFAALDHVGKFIVDDFNIDQVPVKNSTQSSSHPSANTQVVLIPVFTQSYPQYYQFPGYSPFYHQHPGSFPIRYQSPVFNPYSFLARNHGGTRSFPYFSPEQGYNPIGRNNQFPQGYQSRFMYPWPPIGIIDH